MKVECAGCPESFEPEDLKDVGNHLFCATCFDNLLKPAPSPDLAPLELIFETQSEDNEPELVNSKLCFVCREPMPDGPDTTLGGLGICLSCREGLTLHIPEDEPAAAEASVPMDEKPPGPMYTPGSTSIQFVACPKMMPGPGSYHEVDGAAYCAECFYAGKAEVASPVNADAAKPAMPVKQALGPTEGAGESCDACMRPLVQGEFDRISGFRICRACISSNQTLALAIARVRHERFLEKIAKDLT